jgi:hypothetical protein
MTPGISKESLIKDIKEAFIVLIAPSFNKPYLMFLLKSHQNKSFICTSICGWAVSVRGIVMCGVIGGKLIILCVRRLPPPLWV